MGDRHDVVALLAGAAERALGHARYPDRRMGLLHRARIDRDIFKIPELAGVAERFVSPDAKDYFDRFIVASAAIVELHAEHVVLARAVAHTHPELQAAARDGVGDRVVFGDVDGVTEGDDRDRA